MPLDRLKDSDLVKLKSDFQQVLKTSATTNIRGNSDPSAATMRRLLATKGWGRVLKTDDDVADLAYRCGLDVSAYLTGSRAGKGKTLIIRDPQGRPLGRSTTTPSGALHEKAQKLFKFDLGTKKNRAAAMYLSGAGATTEEVVQEVGDPKLNLLREVEKMGYRVEKTKVKSQTGRTVTRYKILT